MPPRRTGWGKYLKHYKTKWEREVALKDWIKPSSEEDVNRGKPEAYCKWCECHLRAHHHDLVLHSTRTKHLQRKSVYEKNQSQLKDHGYVVAGNDEKTTDLKLAVFIAMHCAIKSIDHLGEILKSLGKGSQLQNLKLHRTKCSKLIQNVIAPADLSELLKDVGTSKYSLIVDESTDVSSFKFMAVCIRYYSRKHKRFVTDFLGIFQVISCKGEDLAKALIQFMTKIGLILENFHSVGTDGAPNMCGVNNSFFTHLRVRFPRLILIKCVCHSLHKCAEHAFTKVPQHLRFILTEVYNWIGGSAKRLALYQKLYKARNNGKTPIKLQSLSTTRWLIWLPVSSIVVEQWDDIGAFLHTQSLLPENKKDDTLSKLVPLLEDGANLLYFTFMRTILKDLDRVNQAFEHTSADITKLFSDLRSVVYSIASRILKDRAIAQTTRPGVLRLDEAEMLKNALSNQDNHLPLEQVKFGESFRQQARMLNLPDDALRNVKIHCCSYLLSLAHQLVDRLPSNLSAIRKLQNLTPRNALAKVGRPAFDQLPLDLVSSADLDTLESQWLTLGTLPLHEVCPHTDLNRNVESLDIEHFWACVLECKTATGKHPFKELALFALMALTLPISNAVVERIFSFMSIIKSKLRNRMQMKMLEALIRLRAHLKAFGKCCVQFTATPEMLTLFNSDMYSAYHEDDVAVPVGGNAAAGLEIDYDEDSVAEDDPEAMVLDDDEDLGPTFHVAEGEDLPDQVYDELMKMFEESTNCPLA